MRETEFIDQNKEKWLELEKLGASKKKDPEKLSDLFIEATNDLSYSKSYYPSRSIRVYLNNLSLKVHSNVYKTRQSTWERVKKLWLEQIPRAYYEARKTVLLSFIIFFLGVFIGVFSAHQDPGFIGLMLSEEYIQMTMDNIENGKPFGVYSNGSHMDLFTYITLNNIRVSFLVFVLGLFFMVGTVGALIHNGAMLGAFHYMFYEHGLLGDSLITVWMHGMPEISAIILAGAAGIELGRGLIFTGSYTRKESFLLGAKKGVLMIIGLIPVFFFAGFVEGFATRYTQVPDFIRIIFILVCAAFMLTYFVIMPRIRFKGRFSRSVAEDQVPDSATHEYALHKIKKHGQLFSDTFAFYSAHFTAFILPALLAAVSYVGILYLTMKEDFMDHFATTYIPSLGDFFSAAARAFIKVDNLYELLSFPILYPLNALLIAAVIYLSLRQLVKGSGFGASYLRDPGSSKLIIGSLLISFIGHLCFFLPNPLSVLLALAAAPFLLTALLTTLLPQDKEIGLNRALRIVWRHGFRRAIGLVLVLYGCAGLFMLFFNSGLTDYLLQTILGGIQMEQETFNLLMLGVNILFMTWSLLMVIPLFVFAGFFNFWTAYEIDTARHLNQEIADIGRRHKAFGILREES